jgi:hypothetical protein
MTTRPSIVVVVVAFDRCDGGAASSFVVAVVADVAVVAAISDSTTATSSDRAESAGRTRERARKRKDGTAEATLSPVPRIRAVSRRRWIVASPMIELFGRRERK